MTEIASLKYKNYFAFFYNFIFYFELLELQQKKQKIYITLSQIIEQKSLNRN